MLEPASRQPLPGVAVVAADRRVRDGLASVLAATGEVEVVGLAADSPAVLRLAGSRRPELILVDPALTGQGDGTLVAQLRRHVPLATILVVDWDDGSDPVLAREADGVLNVARLPAALVDALSAAGLGRD